MSYSVVESFDDRELEGDLEEKRYRRVFFVTSSTPECNQAEVAAASGVPLRGSAFEGPNGFTDAQVYCKNVRVQQRPEGPTFFKVICDYTSRFDRQPGATINGQGGTLPGGTTPTEAATSPLLRPPSVTWGLNRFQRVLWKDINGDLIANSAEKAFSPPPEIEVCRRTLTIVRNRADFPALGLDAYHMTVNSVEWAGFDALTVRCNGITAEYAQELGVQYWAVRYEFEVDPNEWVLELLDAGYEQKDGAGGWKPILIAARTPSTPQLLNSLGVAIGLGGTPEYKTYHIYPRIDFNLLGIFT